MMVGQQVRGGDLISDLKIPRGRWVRIDQEVILNKPGAENGTLRLWVDRTLVGELSNFVMRQSPDTKIELVQAAAYFGSSATNTDGLAAKDERILMTPFELRW
jgi:hypothetical protein